MDQIQYNQVLQQNYSAIHNCPAPWETLLQRKSVEMQLNQTYVPNEASIHANKPMDQIQYNQVLQQNCSAIPNCPAAWETLLQRERVEMQFYQTYVPNEASVQVNKPMDQIHNNQMPLQNCPAIPNCRAAWETLPQRESVKMQFNQTYAPNKASLQVNKPIYPIHYNQVLLQNCSAIPDCADAWETLLQRKSVEMQFNKTYVPNEASVKVNKPMDQIHNNQVLQQSYSAIPNCPATWETLLQRKSVEMLLNETYVPNEASVQVNKPMDQIHNNQMPLQNCPAIPNCPAPYETLPQRESVKMQFNQTYAPDKASLQVNKPKDPVHYNQVLLQNCSAIPDCAAAWETLLQRESVEQSQQETEQTINNLYSKGHRSARMPSTKRREKNRERERIRQTRLKKAFNVLRSVIPDYISEREPGDRLSRIQTLRLAKKYIATLHELLETCAVLNQQKY